MVEEPQIVAHEAHQPDFIAVLALSRAQERLRREINPSVYSRSELRAKLKEKGGFLDRVMSGAKLFLIGNDDDLGQLVENRSPRVP